MPIVFCFFSFHVWSKNLFFIWLSVLPSNQQTPFCFRCWRGFFLTKLQEDWIGWNFAQIGLNGSKFQVSRKRGEDDDASERWGRKVGEIYVRLPTRRKLRNEECYRRIEDWFGWKRAINFGMEETGIVQEGQEQ